ncbi:MAG TPA: CoA transferase [Steroidobacteraceae bacterium]
MSLEAPSVVESVWTELGGSLAALETLQLTGDGVLPSCFAVTDLASAAIAAAGLSVVELAWALGSEPPAIRVDRRLASMWFDLSIRPMGWTLPPARDPIMGDYRAKDGWIRLHTNAPRHRSAAERVLGRCDDARAAAQRVATWCKGELEASIVQAGGCAAEMRSAAEWSDHPQGRAVAAEPLIYFDESDERVPSGRWPESISRPDATRPLAGVRVLDLTRVLAGPVATRFLAGYGADVLRIDPPDWSEPGVVPEVTVGKRCARLDLHSSTGRTAFESLLAGADVLVHGYRPSALERLGFGAARRRALAPGLIDVCLDAYGWSGPWAERRGFDSLVQMSAGIADAGLSWQRADRPVPLPVQALDHATGYLAAAAAIRGLVRRPATGRGLAARLSLARTAKLLLDLGAGDDEPPLSPESPRDVAEAIEATPWGGARRLNPPVSIQHVPMHWSLPAAQLGSSPPVWRT